jgi:hypothetical protein
MVKKHSERLPVVKIFPVESFKPGQVLEFYRAGTESSHPLDVYFLIGDLVYIEQIYLDRHRAACRRISDNHQQIIPLDCLRLAVGIPHRAATSPGR